MNQFIKRLFDICLSLFLIVLLIPVWILIPVFIVMDSKGSPFFLQDRLTKNGRVFKMIKFRSMVVNAEKEGTGLFNYANDSRVTKVGKFLRTTSLDELPQLFNIFIGDMSFVGPRPCVSYELGDYNTLNRKYKKRFEVVAGLTGLAQVKGRNDISWEEKVKYDNEYIDRFKKEGVLLDLRIMIETFLKVFRKENIYENKVDDEMSDYESAKLAEEMVIKMAHMPDQEEEK